MSVKATARKAIKFIVFRTPIVRDYVSGYRLYPKYARCEKAYTKERFFQEHRRQFCCEPLGKSKTKQLSRFLSKVDICPADNDTFLYSLDCMKTVQNKNPIYGNCTANYEMIVHGSLHEVSESLLDKESAFAQEEQNMISALRDFLARCHRNASVAEKYSKQLDAIESLFERPAQSFFEALQRILFFNQLLWQTGHKLNGLGHLDWILEDLYYHDLASGSLTRDTAKEILRDFFNVLHDNYWFKSSALLGDTGQIIILGGRDINGNYHCNELTYLFIEVSKELRLPDPKVLLRCTADMPQDLLEAAVDCIATGIGAPLLSNDDEIIPDLISCGFEETDVFDYGTAACWEPLIPGVSCDANNVVSLNFAVPLVRLLNSNEFVQCDSLESLLMAYEALLRTYIQELVMPLTTLIFEEDPLLSLISPSSLLQQKDFTRGGAKYNHLGLTSVGMGTVVNSMLNIEKLVYREKRYTAEQLNAYRKENFAGCEDLLQELKNLPHGYGSDDDAVVALTRRIMSVASNELNRYHTKFDGRFKVGLSSPNYISDAEKVEATFDGRKDGEPFGVHISSEKAIPTTELLSFAMKLDYRDNRVNGNVIDFITSPGMLAQNREKYVAMLRTGFSGEGGGIFQLQMNVVDSKTLIAAKANPTLFPQLVVRVWGFSAYFNDLPDEYKDVLIARALESERIA